MAGYYTYTFTDTSVGAALLRTTINRVPANGLIHRIRANVSAGTAINGVRVVISNARTGGTPPTYFQTVIDTGLLVNPLDSAIVDPMLGTYQIQIPLPYTVQPNQSAGAVGDMEVWVATDDATLDHTVDVIIDIEDVGPDARRGF